MFFMSFSLFSSFVLALVLTSTTAQINGTNDFSNTLPGCQTHCGDMAIPYPFGIGTNCSLNSYFNLTCNKTNTPPTLLLADIVIYNISDSQMRVTNGVANKCYNSSGYVGGFNSYFTLPELYPFTFSQANKFFLIGCDDSIEIYGKKKNLEFTFSCVSFCSGADAVINGTCSGIGCCQTSIPEGIKYYNISMDTKQLHATVLSYNPCGYAFLGDADQFKFRGLEDLNDLDFYNRTRDTVHVVWDWVVSHNQSCELARKEISNYACKENSFCHDTDSGGYRCSCNEGYRGNPYLDGDDRGCQDINECMDLDQSPCNTTCFNTPGNYSCSCPMGYDGDGKRNGTGCFPKPGESNQGSPILQLALGLTAGCLFLVITIVCVYVVWRKRNFLKMRENFFQQNGGLLMKQKISFIQGGEESTKIFTCEELEKASNYYSEDRILGQGGYGTVYKGILPDKRVVAIKKSKIVDATQIEQFINEVIILTQVNHRNVVKLFGCCLEAEVPLLVYEYISNGTLFFHIHNRETNWLSLENRLRIAVEAAGALAYLHSEASMPIIHRDVKSANILVDHNYTAKIADFGASRLVPLDRTQVTTLVQGTLGYLDPEYFHTSKLTEKSDVYSFGVVLAELLTGQLPLCMERTKEETNLATYFIMSVKENRLFKILEPQIVREGSLDQLQAIGELVKSCLALDSDNRPTMKEVAAELENLRKFTRHPWISQQNNGESECLITTLNEPCDLYSNIPESLGQSTSDTTMLIFSLEKDGR